MYRLTLESLLGLYVADGKLHFAPCLPQAWKKYTLRYRYRETLYLITVLQPDGPSKEMNVTVDGNAQPHAEIMLLDDRREHLVEVMIRGALP